MPVRLVVGVVASALALCALSACGGSDDKPAHSPTPTSTVKEHVISSAAAKKALLTAKDVGAPLTKVAYRRPTSPLFCNPSTAPTVYAETGAGAVVGARFTSTHPTANILEEVYIYKSSTAARAALSMVQADMDCATGHIYNNDGTSALIAVGASTDYSAKLTADFVYGWSLRTTDSRGLELAVPVGTTLMLFRYTAGNKSDINALPDAFDLATTAVNRLSKA
jgi:hypothetical protein